MSDCDLVPNFRCPTQDGFLWFIRKECSVDQGALPDNSPFIEIAFHIAKDTAPHALKRASRHSYTRAVYLLGMDRLVLITQDSAFNGDGTGYFFALRQKFGVNNLSISNIVTSTSDNGTSTSIAIPEFIQKLNLAELQYLKTPWGQQYMALAQQTGEVWGLS